MGQARVTALIDKRLAVFLPILLAHNLFGPFSEFWQRDCLVQQAVQLFGGLRGNPVRLFLSRQLVELFFGDQTFSFAVGNIVRHPKRKSAQGERHGSHAQSAQHVRRDLEQSAIGVSARGRSRRLRRFPAGMSLDHDRIFGGNRR